MNENIRILTVDDEDSITEIVKEFIELAGTAEVVVENDPGAAIHKLKNVRFDLIITDHHMPGHTGIDILELARTAGNQNYDTPVVFLTAMETDTHKELQKKYKDVSIFNKVDNLHLIGIKVKELLPDF